MKMKNLSMFALIALVVVFSACSVTKRHYAPGYHVEFKKFGKVENVAEVKNEKAAKSVVAAEEVAVVANEVVAPMAIAPVVAVVANEEVAAVVVAPAAKHNAVQAIAAKVAEFRSNKSVVENNEASITAAHANGFKPEWYHYLLMWCFGWLYLAYLTSKNEGAVNWKVVGKSILLTILCVIPGIIYNFKWLKENM